MSQYKLTESKVKKIKIEIFRNNCKKYGIKDLADKYGVSTMQITRIARGECWKDIMPDFRRRKNQVKITPKDVVEKIIIELKSKKKLQKEIAVEYGVTSSVVSRIKSKMLHKRK